MNTENFLELPLANSDNIVCVAKTSIAVIESKNIGCIVTLKEKRADGSQIVFDVALSYLHLKNEINKWEKIAP